MDLAIKIFSEKIKQLQKVLVKSTGICFQKYNLRVYIKRNENFDKNDIRCKQIILLNSLKKKIITQQNKKLK